MRWIAAHTEENIFDAVTIKVCKLRPVTEVSDEKFLPRREVTIANAAEHKRNSIPSPRGNNEIGEAIAIKVACAQHRRTDAGGHHVIDGLCENK